MPPLAVTVMLPVLDPLQFASVAAAVAVMAAGWLTVAVAVIVQLLASLTVSV